MPKLNFSLGSLIQIPPVIYFSHPSSQFAMEAEQESFTQNHERKLIVGAYTEPAAFISYSGDADAGLVSPTDS